MEVFYLIMIIIVVLTVKSLVLVPEGYGWVIELLGKPRGVLKPGINLIVPFFTKIKAKVSLKDQEIRIPAQEVLIEDKIKAAFYEMAFYRIVDPIKVAYEVEDVRRLVSYMIQHSIREITSGMKLDEIMDRRKDVERELEETVNKAMEKLGLQLIRINITDIRLPKEINELYQKREQQQIQDMVLGKKIANENKEQQNINNDWYKDLKKHWENNDLNGIVSLFDKNVTYYKDENTRLYTIDEIKEEWKEILEEGYDRLEFKIVMSDNKGYILNIKAIGRISNDIVVKLEFGNDGKCTYFRKWGEIL